MNRMTKIASATAALLVVSACSNSPDLDTFGGRLQLQGGEVAKIGKQWSEGEEAIAKGRRMIEDGRDDVDDAKSLRRDGEKKIDRGEDLVREGERTKREAETAYRLRAAAQGDVATQ